MKIVLRISAVSFMIMGCCPIAFAMNPAATFLQLHATSKPCQILEVVSDATEIQINEAFKKLALKWHPDKNLAFKASAEDVFKKISEARDVMLSGFKSGKIPTVSTQAPFQNKPAAAAAQSLAQAHAIREKVKRILLEIMALSVSVDRRKTDINKAIKLKLKMSDFTYVDYSHQPRKVSGLISNFLQEFKILVGYSLELKRLSTYQPQPTRPEFIALIADYAQFLQSLTSNAAFMPDEKERTPISDSVATAINQYENVYGKLNVTLTAQDKEDQERAQGTFKKSAEEEADPSCWKGLDAQRYIFKDRLFEVQRKVEEKVSPYAELERLIDFHKSHINQVLDLEVQVKRNKKALSNPVYYSQWIDEAAQTIESLIGDPQLKLEDSQRKILSDKLKENRLLFIEKFNK